MKILYISFHPVLEYDEIRLLEDLGHDVFSIGAYFDRTIPNYFRPELKQNEWHLEMISNFRSGSSSKSSMSLDHSFVREFDAVIVMHQIEWLNNNPNSFKDARIIIRSVGQPYEAHNHPSDEIIDKCVLIKYSENESIPFENRCKTSVIKFYKRESDFFGWLGSQERVISFYNNPVERVPNYIRVFDDIVRKTNTSRKSRFYGYNTTDLLHSGGQLDYHDQLKILRDSRVALSIPSFPAPYTLNFIEMLMSGIPVIVPSDKFASELAESSNKHPGLYMQDRILANKENGFVVSCVDEAIDVCKMMLADYKLAYDIGSNGRICAIQNFGHENAMREWNTLLESL